MKIINFFLRLFFGLISFPILMIVYYVLRLFSNFSTITNGFLTALYDLFHLKIRSFLLNLLVFILELIGFVIDLPFGVIASTHAALLTSISIPMSNLGFRDVPYMIKRAPLRKER
jgi:hypothetical protein